MNLKTRKTAIVSDRRPIIQKATATPKNKTGTMNE